MVVAKVSLINGKKLDKIRDSLITEYVNSAPDYHIESTGMENLKEMKLNNTITFHQDIDAPVSDSVKGLLELLHEPPLTKPMKPKKIKKLISESQKEQIRVSLDESND